MKTAYEKRWKWGTNAILFGKGLKEKEYGFYFTLIFLIILLGKMLA